MTKETIKTQITKALKKLGYTADFAVEYPLDMKNGDYSTNVALVLSKQVGKSPKELAEEILGILNEEGEEMFERIEVAGPGFINFYLSKKFFKQSLKYIIKEDKKFGRLKKLERERIMVEYTDPNPFKEFHIGHLMSNTIGEAVSRMIEWSGAEVRRANYQGDVGMHVAKAVWALLRGEKDNVYAIGNKAYDEDLESRGEIEKINKMIYDRSDKSINKIYDEGREESLKYFEKIYKKLGTHFDYYFFESEVAEAGKKIVLKNIGKIFENTEGPVVFRAELHDPMLHTRVFINSLGLPTYEAKDLGNAKNKYDKYKYTKSIVITANEIREYFKVVLMALSLIYPELAEKTKHLPHGMLKLTTGKMSSRTGDVITGEALIGDVKTNVKDNEELAIAAIKYMILRQSIGNDIVFDVKKSISTDGDSGVYLEYAYARANSVLEKSGKKGSVDVEREKTHEIERLLHRFPEVLDRAVDEYAPHHMVTYLTELASSFNNFYAHEQVISEDKESKYRLAIVEAFKVVMRNGLTILGIPVLERV